MKTLKIIEEAINITNAMMLEHPENPMFKVIIRTLGALKTEFSQLNLNKDKIHSLHYGFLRAYEEVAGFEGTTFDSIMGELLLDLNEY